MAGLRGWLILLVIVALLVGGVVAVRKLSETEAARLAKLRPEVETPFSASGPSSRAKG